MTFHIRDLSSPILGVSRLNHPWMLRDHFTPDSKPRLLPPSWLWWALWSLFPVRDQVSNLSVLRCIFEPTVWLDMFGFFFFKKEKNKSRHTRESKWSPHDPKHVSCDPSCIKVTMVEKRWPLAFCSTDYLLSAPASGSDRHCFCLPGRWRDFCLHTHSATSSQSLPPGKWGRKVLPCTALPSESYFQVPPARLKQHFQASVPEVQRCKKWRVWGGVLIWIQMRANNLTAF